MVAVNKKSQLPKNKNIESIYPLSPMQEGMLFHSLYTPESGVYVEQMVLTLSGQFQPKAFQKAWQTVVNRHSVFRTLFVWEKRQQPLQIVLKEVELPWNYLNWQEFSAQQQQQKLEELLQTDKKEGFKFNQAPLMRCTIIKLSQQAYKFIWSHHHILIDGWCSPIIWGEVWTFYEAECQGKNCHLPTPKPYKNYISWLQNQDLSKAKAFWQKTLSGFQAPTPLMVDRLKKNEASSLAIYREQKLKLWLETTKALQSLAKQNKVTLSTVIQGIWAVLLSKYSGESDVLFGVTVSGRPPSLLGVESMVGLFINTLPLRVKVPSEDSFWSLLQSLQQQQIDIQEYSYTPLVEIQKVSEITGGISLFESIVVFENYPEETSALQSSSFLQIENLEYFEQTNYPLTLIATPAQEFELKVSYDSNRFETDTIVRMTGHFRVLVEEIVTNPSQSISQLTILTEAEQYKLLVEWNDSQVEYPQDKCIHQLFEEQVKKTPEAIALVSQKEQLTYQQLNQKANQLAHYLPKIGVKPETLVGICGERSLEMIIGLLGILKAGAAYVPFDPNYPLERLNFMLEDTGISILLTTQSLKNKSFINNPKIINLFNNKQLNLSQKNNLDLVLKSDNLAYIIYTSGSTGKPKGVLVPHHAVNRLVCNTNYIEINSSDNIAHIANNSFDASTFEIWGALLNGATLTLFSSETILQIEHFVNQLQEKKISVIFITTALFNKIASLNPQAFTSLKYVLFGGEKVQTKWVREVYEKGCPQKLIHVYGPTENTTFSTWYWLKELSKNINNLPIGSPISNTTIYLLDSNLQPVPIGVIGEIYLGGEGLAKGYLNRKQLTAEKFIANPFDSGKLYKTGDLGRYLSDGNIEFIGRIDHQVKIRGFRIELGEIETILNQHSQVKHALVLPQENPEKDKYLVAYVIAKENQKPERKELRQFLTEKLPEYMIPSAMVFLDAFPLTSNGKIDRKALPKEDWKANRKEQFIAPSNETEMKLASIWQEVLGIEKVGIKDNFFALGGHSLLATQVISRIRNGFQIELPLRYLFESPTISEFSDRLNDFLWIKSQPESSDDENQPEDIEEGEI